VDNNGAQINEAPFVIYDKAFRAMPLFTEPGRNPQDINALFMAKIFDMPFKPLLVGATCYRGYHEEVCPCIKPAQVERHHVHSPMLFKKRD
jgi:hypothetical protein